MEIIISLVILAIVYMFDRIAYSSLFFHFSYFLFIYFFPFGTQVVIINDHENRSSENVEDPDEI